MVRLLMYVGPYVLFMLFMLVLITLLKGSMSHGAGDIAMDNQVFDQQIGSALGNQSSLQFSWLLAIVLFQSFLLMLLLFVIANRCWSCL